MGETRLGVTAPVTVPEIVAGVFYALVDASSQGGPHDAENSEQEDGHRDEWP